MLRPQGLDYVVAFLGAMQAGLIAVPLSVPQLGYARRAGQCRPGRHHPTVVLTTSAVAATVADYLRRPDADGPDDRRDRLTDLDDPESAGLGISDAPSTAYLQYTSGSTRLPAGVMVSHRNLQVEFRAADGRTTSEFGWRGAAGYDIVSWLPFYHDMGLMLGDLRTDPGRLPQ